jgi:hypothetical protein
MCLLMLASISPLVLQVTMPTRATERTSGTDPYADGRAVSSGWSFEHGPCVFWCVQQVGGPLLRKQCRLVELAGGPLGLAGEECRVR